MFIRTIKPNLLIGPVCYPEGAKVEVREGIGKRLVEQAAAVPIAQAEFDTPELPSPADEPETNEPETRTVPLPRARAASRTS